MARGIQSIINSASNIHTSSSINANFAMRDNHPCAVAAREHFYRKPYDIKKINVKLPVKATLRKKTEE